MKQSSSIPCGSYFVTFLMARRKWKIPVSCFQCNNAYHHIHGGGGGVKLLNSTGTYVKLGSVKSLASSPLKQRQKKPEVSSKSEVTCDKAAGKVCVSSAIASGNGFVERAQFPHGHGSRKWQGAVVCPDRCCKQVTRNWFCYLRTGLGRKSTTV